MQNSLYYDKIILHLNADRLIWIVWGILVLGLASCQPVDANDSEDRQLARVHNKTLHLSELDGMFPENTTSSDSQAIIDAYRERWIREALVLHEAERNIPSDLNIDKLVRDYRASLIRHNYEKILVEERLDSTISKEELEEFYNRNKEQYQLETPIVRCFFVKVRLPVTQADQLRSLWNNQGNPESFQELATFCDQFAEEYLLEDSTWYKVEEIAAQMPAGTLTTNNISAKKDFSQRDDSYQYYLKVFDVKNRKDIAPLSYIEDQARKFILHRRKIKLLEDIREDMYELEMRRNNIEIYTQ